MKVTIIEKGHENDFRRIDKEVTFFAVDYWNAEGTNLLYFRLNRYNLKTVSIEDLKEIEF